MKSTNLKRKIAIFTGNRAEYGLQYPIIAAVKNHPDLTCHLMVSGAHLDPNFGNTLEEIKNDGFDIDCEIKIPVPEDSLYGTTQAIGSAIINISKELHRLKPDIFVVYADRFEGFAAVVAGTQMAIPVAHIEGGDLTEGGALDDMVRHAMTKLAHLHFTTNEDASRRIRAMGEESWRVHTVGFPMIDLIKDKKYSTKEEIKNKLPIDYSKPIVLFTQHSVTTEYNQAMEQLMPSIQALEKLADEGVQIIATFPNNDAGGLKISRMLAERLQNKTNFIVRNSLGRYLYHGILALALDRNIKVACVGNSSSGIKETPAFGCPTVNIGSRQERRLRGENVIDCSYNEQEIYNAIQRCFSDSDFRKTCFTSINPYGLGDAGIKIAKILSEVELGKKIILKKMTI